MFDLPPCCSRFLYTHNPPLPYILNNSIVTCVVLKLNTFEPLVLQRKLCFKNQENFTFESSLDKGARDI